MKNLSKALAVAMVCAFSMSAQATTYVVKPLKPVIQELCKAKASESKGRYKQIARKYGVTNADLEWLEDQPVCNGVKMGGVGKP